MKSARRLPAALTVLTALLALVAARGAVSDSVFTPSDEAKKAASLTVSSNDSVLTPSEEVKRIVSLSVATNAHVVGGLAIRKVQDLEFGDVRGPGGAGSVTVRVAKNTKAERMSAGGVVLAGTSFSAARFFVSRSGADVSRVDVTLPARAILSRVGGSEIATVEDFVSTVVPECAQASCPASVVVGATVRIPASSVGRYVGTFTVTVNAF